MASFVVDNNVESLVADDPLTSGAVTLNVNTGHGARFPSTFPYRLTIWDDSTYPDPTDDPNMETVHCTGRSTDALTIARGEEGTSGVEHALGSRVALLFTAGLFNDATYGVTTKLDTIETNADVTDATNVEAAGAVMDADKDVANGVVGIDASGDVNIAAAKHIILPLHNDGSTPTLGFGDGDSGLYESADDTLSIALAGALKYHIKDTGIEAAISNGPCFRRETASATNPTLIPGTNDLDTGIGNGGADILSLIAGGVEGIRITELEAAISIALYGNLTTTGTIDGRDVATDGTKLDTIEESADVTDAFNVAQAWLGEVDKNTPANDDTFPIADSAASNVLKKLKWSNLKATLKTYFDTLYNLYVHPNHSGDVTSVADGAQTIVADAVTYAKMQNVTGGDRILGRSTAGSGIVEEVTCTAAARAFLDDTNVATQVDTLGLTNALNVSIWLPAESAYLPVTNPAGLVEELGATTYAGFSYLTFDDTTSEHAVWRVPMPDYDGGNIVVTSFSKIATTPSGAVTGQYNILTIGLANSEEFDAASTADTGVNISHSFFTTESLTEIMTASATIDPANVAADDLMVIELSRDVASDNLPGDLELVGILIEYTRT